jgi:putative membrane protein
MTWWCSAQGQPWAWVWRPYAGVWLLVALLVVAYVVGLRRLHRATGGAGVSDTVGRRAAFALGVLTFWAGADWPLATLGAGYLLSVHMVQYLLFSMVAPPLLLYGLPPEGLRRFLGRGARWRLARVLSQPLVAFACFNVVLLGTHLPEVVDGWGRSQLGSFAMDMAWVGAGLVFWWQVLAPVAELGALSYPGRILFLVANIFVPTVPASFLTFADYPIYSLYELAPRVGGITAAHDQQLAGILMKIGGGAIIFATASVLFFQWYHHEERAGMPNGRRSAVRG